VAVLTGPVRLLVLDPFYLSDCWENCSPGSNLLLVAGNTELARLLGTLRDLAATGFVAAALAVLVRRRRAPSRGLLMPTGIAILGVLAFGASRGLAHVAGPESPGEDRFWLPFTAEALALGCVGVSVCAAALVISTRRARVERLVADLTSEQAPVRDVLSRRLGDPALEVAYWLPDGCQFVDASGARVEEPSGNRTTVRRRGATIAVITHRRTDEPLVETLGPAGLLAIDNERLRAEVLVRLADLRASRARIVVAADESRRALERDLHDGAQQMLLALSYELRLAGLGDAVTEATAAIADLRELANGLHPAILEEAGLGPALEDLAERARMPVQLSLGELALGPDLRRDARATVYAVVAAVVDGAAGPLVLATTSVDGNLVLRVEGQTEIDRTHILDRVGALGGTVEVADGTLKAVIPCAWSSPKTHRSPVAG
jgi:signal transduction histidine kinase